MHNEQKIHDTSPPTPVDGGPAEETAGVKVYERPPRRTVPKWTWLGFLALVLVLAWIVIQVIR